MTQFRNIEKDYYPLHLYKIIMNSKAKIFKYFLSLNTPIYFHKEHIIEACIKNKSKNYLTNILKKDDFKDKESITLAFLYVTSNKEKLLLLTQLFPNFNLVTEEINMIKEKYRFSKEDFDKLTTYNNLRNF